MHTLQTIPRNKRTSGVRLRCRAQNCPGVIVGPIPGHLITLSQDEEGDRRSVQCPCGESLSFRVKGDHRGRS